MARTRLIKPGFFKNEQLADCSPWVRLFYIGLWTQADREGFVEYRPRKLKAEIFPYDDGIPMSLLVVTLHDKKFLDITECDGTTYLHIPAFAKHQRPHPHEPASVVVVSRCRRLTSEEIVTLHGESCHVTSSCALPSFNPSILQSSNPSIGQPSVAGVPKVSKTNGTHFQKPTIAEVAAYCQERAKGVDPQAWLDHYEANGWKVGKNPMKNWRAAVRTWERSALTASANRGLDLSAIPDDPL